MIPTELDISDKEWQLILLALSSLKMAKQQLADLTRETSQECYSDSVYQAARANLLFHKIVDALYPNLDLTKVTGD